MFILIIAALVSSTFGEGMNCNPYVFETMVLNATSGVSYKYVVDHTANISYFGDVEGNSFRFANATSGELYVFDSGSCRKSEDPAPPLTRCLPKNESEYLSRNRLGGFPKPRLGIRTYRYTVNGMVVIDSYIRRRQFQVLFLRNFGGMNYLFFDMINEGVNRTYLDQDVSSCS